MTALPYKYDSKWHYFHKNMILLPYKYDSIGRGGEKGKNLNIFVKNVFILLLLCCHFYMAMMSYLYDNAVIFIWQCCHIYMTMLSYLYDNVVIFIWQCCHIYMTLLSYLYTIYCHIFIPFFKKAEIFVIFIWQSGSNGLRNNKSETLKKNFKIPIYILQL